MPKNKSAHIEDKDLKILKKISLKTKAKTIYKFTQAGRTNCHLPSKNYSTRITQGNTVEQSYRTNTSY